MSITALQRKELAGKAGIDEQYLYQCLTGRRDMRPSLAIKVEALANGLVTRCQLRRDWADVWPSKTPRPAAMKARKATKAEA